jgi:hypothetical protein
MLKTLSIFFLSFLFLTATQAQTTITDYFSQAPKQKTTTLVRKDNAYQFKTEKWDTVDNKELWPYLFGVENDKFWTGQKVSAIRLAGWWPIGSKAVGYMYAADLEAEDGSFVPSVFISSFNTETERKGIDVDPFSQAPSPTGMRGKIVVTQTVQVTTQGLFTLTNKHQSPAKVLSKKVRYTIGEDGAVEVQ